MITLVTNTLIKQNSFLVLGRAGMDLYADPPGTQIEDALSFTAALGGSAGNIAVAIARLGGSASLVTSVSDDAIGRYTIKQLKLYGVGTEHIRAVGGEARNSLAVVETRAENCQSIIYRNGAADFQLTVEQVQPISFSRFGALIVTGTALAVEPSRAASFLAIEMARAAGLPVVLDVDYRPYSWRDAHTASEVCTRVASLSTIVIGNDVEFDVMAGTGNGLALAEKLATSSAAICVYKMGEKGAVTFAGSKSFETAIFPVTALKPTGAGDSFMGAFLTGLAAGMELETCIERGAAAAAIVVTGVGCAPAMPTPTELDAFIKAHEKKR
jgi:5-dehydro-2-deoxygluconokinase